MTSHEISIQNRGTFQTIITELTEMNSTLKTKLESEGQAVIDAVKAAAKSDSGTAAPAYTGTIAALSQAVQSVNARATEVSNSVENKIADLQKLLDGTGVIDDTGAEAVRNAG